MSLFPAPTGSDPDPDQAWTLDDGQGLRIRVAALGAAWISCQVPLADGSTREVLAGFDDPADCARNEAYMGAVLGRCANRISGGVLRTLTPPVVLDKQAPFSFQLHGGPVGFAHHVWQLHSHSATHLALRHHSPAGDQGYPGTVQASIHFELGRGPAGEAEVRVAFHAEADALTPLNFTHHPYFQLDGRQGLDVRAQRLQLAACLVLPVDHEGVPTGAPAPVDGTALDFRSPRRMDALPPEAPATLREVGYDHAFLLPPELADLHAPAARLWAADGRMALALFSSFPSVQVYTANFTGPGTARCAKPWGDHSAVAIEAQYLPDSPNHPEWPQPSCWLQPGQRYAHRVVYRFEALAKPI